MTEDDRPSSANDSATEVVAKPEVEGPNAEYICRVVAAYSAAQSLALARETGLKREDFSPENLAGLKGPDLQEMIKGVAANWDSDEAMKLRTNFTANNQIENSTVHIDDESAREEIAEIVKYGSAMPAEKQYADRLAKFIVEANRKINLEKAEGHDTSSLIKARDFFMKERKLAAHTAMVFIGQVKSFFESDFATKSSMGRTHLLAVLAAAGQGNKEYARKLESGISAEIGLSRMIASTVENSGKEDVEFRAGEAEEDAKGGDLVYKLNGRTFFIDVKSTRPRNMDANADYDKEPSITRSDGFDYKFTMWLPEGAEVDKHFNIEDENCHEIVDRMVAEMNELAVAKARRVGSAPTRAVRFR